jgi:hypothetical protein
MVKVTILGGKHCRKAIRFEKRLMKTAEALNIKTEVIRKTTLAEFMSYHTYLLPTVLFNQKMVRGRFPKNRELKMLLLEAEKR